VDLEIFLALLQLVAYLRRCHRRRFQFVALHFDG
jgi:hypothetical protein